MRVIITKKEEFESKTGVGYVKCSAISVADGEAVEIFTTKENFDKFELPRDVEVPTAILTELANAKEVRVLDVEFNNKGRLVTVRLAE